MLIISFSQIYTCCAFYQPKANLFCSKWRVWCDSRVILSNKKLELSQLATTWCVARQVWTWLVKCATSLFNSFCSKVAKQVVARLTVQVVALGKDWIVLYFYITYIIKSAIQLYMYAHSNSLIFCKSGSQICGQMFVRSVGIKTRASLRILQVSLASSDRQIQRCSCFTVFVQTIIPELPFKFLLQ